MPQDLTLLPKFKDRLSYLYVEHAVIERSQNSIAIYSQTEEGELCETQVPICDIALLMLGPGTKLSHSAMDILARNNCLVAWTGEEAVRMYAFGTGGTHSSERLLKQARLVSDPGLRLQIVRKLYSKRFPEALDDNVTIEQLRGKEGHRVKLAYANQAQKWDIEWQGRSYDRNKWQGSDPVNTALSAANACMYGICHAACLSMGYSPALGFIHSGKQLSFIYDLADLYKLEIVLPIAFRAAAELDQSLPIDRRVRYALRDAFREQRFLEVVAKDLTELFGADENTGQEFDEDPSRPGDLIGGVEGGQNYEDIE